MNKHWVCCLCALLCAATTNIFAQDNVLGTTSNPDDACFKDSPASPVWAEHLTALLSAVRSHSSLQAFDMVTKNLKTRECSEQCAGKSPYDSRG